MMSSKAPAAPVPDVAQNLAEMTAKDALAYLMKAAEEGTLTPEQLQSGLARVNLELAAAEAEKPDERKRYPPGVAMVRVRWRGGRPGQKIERFVCDPPVVISANPDGTRVAVAIAKILLAERHKGKRMFVLGKGETGKASDGRVLIDLDDIVPEEHARETAWEETDE